MYLGEEGKRLSGSHGRVDDPLPIHVLAGGGYYVPVAVRHRADGKYKS